MRRGASWVTWFALLEGLWELLVGTFQRTEVLAGLIAAAIGASFAVVLREVGVMRFTLDPGTAASALKLAWQLPVEFLVATWVLVASLGRGRRVRGRWVRAQYPCGSGGVGRWQRAVGATLGTATPNAIVVDIHDDEALLHSLAPGLPGGREVIQIDQWLWCATCLLGLELPLLLYASAARSRLDALVALEAAGSIGALALIALAEGFHRTSYTIVAVVASLLVFGGGMVFVRFFDRELEP